MTNILQKVPAIDDHLLTTILTFPLLGVHAQDDKDVTFYRTTFRMEYARTWSQDGTKNTNTTREVWEGKSLELLVKYKNIVAFETWHKEFVGHEQLLRFGLVDNLMFLYKFNMDPWSDWLNIAFSDRHRDLPEEYIEQVEKHFPGAAAAMRQWKAEDLAGEHDHDE